MAYIPQALVGNYVKFVRGTPQAWERIKNKNPDTLYFITESAATTGKLYLGDKLISNSSVATGNFADLVDIALGENIYNNSLLVYNSDSGKWEDKPLGDVLSAIVSVMEGATATKDGVSGIVPKPKAGEHTLFLRGDGTWANPADSMDAKIAELLDGDTGSIREIAQDEVAKLVASAPEAYDTLKEIADWIAAHDEATDIVQFAERLNDLEDAVLGIKATVDEDNNIITPATPGLITTVSNLNNIINGTDGILERLNTAETKIETIEERLYWSELVLE